MNEARLHEALDPTALPKWAGLQGNRIFGTHTSAADDCVAAASLAPPLLSALCFGLGSSGASWLAADRIAHPHSLLLAHGLGPGPKSRSERRPVGEEVDVPPVLPPS